MSVDENSNDVCPTGFLTHCSYYKFKIIVLFYQLYNHPYSEPISNFHSIMQFVFQLNCIICHSALILQLTDLFNLLSNTTTKLKHKHNSYRMNTQFANHKRNLFKYQKNSIFYNLFSLQMKLHLSSRKIPYFLT